MTRDCAIRVFNLPTPHSIILYHVQVLVLVAAMVVTVVTGAPTGLPQFNDYRATLPYTPALGYRPDAYYNVSRDYPLMCLFVFVVFNLW